MKNALFFLIFALFFASCSEKNKESIKKDSDILEDSDIEINDIDSVSGDFDVSGVDIEAISDRDDSDAEDSDLVQDAEIVDEDINISIDNISGMWKKSSKLNILDQSCGNFEVEDWKFQYNLIQKSTNNSFIYTSCSDEKCSEKGSNINSYTLSGNIGKYYLEDTASTDNCIIYITEDLQITFNTSSKAYFYWNYHLKLVGSGCAEIANYTECDNIAEIYLEKL